MVGGVNSAEGYQYFLQLKQPRGSWSQAGRFFNAIDLNGDGSLSRDEFSAFQSGLVDRVEGTQSGSQTAATESLLSLLQNAGQIGSTESATETAASSTSQQGTAGDLFSRIDANGDGSISKDEFKQAVSGMHNHQLDSSTGARAQGVSSSLTDRVLAQIDTNGDGSISNGEMTTFESNLASVSQGGGVNNTANSTEAQGAGAMGMASLAQQAIAKYLQLSAGVAIGGAGLGGILATG